MPEGGAPTNDERKVATVLFADLVGSTEFASDEDPERVRALLERFYDAMGSEILSSGGTVEKFAGDAVMAAFGAPAALEDHAERALHAALAMQRRLSELGDDLGLRIGVNTGEVVVGRSREGSSFVSGDAVNVAARLEQAAGAGDILVGERSTTRPRPGGPSERTAAAARGAFEFGEPATVDAKGKPGGVAARRLVRALTLMRPRGVSGLNRSFVGRESELELLQATYKRVVAERRPHFVTVMGDAGVGKTRLVRELWERLGAQSPEPLRRTGRCLPYGHGITYWALGEIVREQLGLLENDPPEIAREKLGKHEILGLALGLEVARDLHPLAARRHQLGESRGDPPRPGGGRRPRARPVSRERRTLRVGLHAAGRRCGRPLRRAGSSLRPFARGAQGGCLAPDEGDRRARARARAGQASREQAKGPARTVGARTIR